MCSAAYIPPTRYALGDGWPAGSLSVMRWMPPRWGPHFPFMQLAVVGGKLLFIGDILESCTFMHGIEDIVRPPWIRSAPPCTWVVNGQERTYPVSDEFGWGQEFQRIGDILEEPDIRRASS